jgi:hypothetical protein
LLPLTPLRTGRVFFDACGLSVRKACA